MLSFLRKILPDNHPFRLLFHRLKAVAAAVWYWFPADKLTVVAITGTNGKTTTTNLTTSVLEATGAKVGMMTTINFQVGDDRWSNTTKQTTASPFMIQKLLRRMVKEGCKYAVLEVSSHAMTQSRILGVNVDVAVITNLTADHIEYHGGYESYREAKGALFRKVSQSARKLGVSKVLILNADDSEYKFFDQFVADRKLTYGLHSAAISALDIVERADGNNFKIKLSNDSVDLDLHLPGRFNVYNALAAASIGIAMNVPIEQIKEGLEKVRHVDGRFEKVDCGQAFNVIVDYAHVPESLESLLNMYKKLTQGELYVVFGATGGGRDKSKRAEMGRVADENADYVIVTNDDPYTEDEWEIIEGVSEGINRREGEKFWKLPDRYEAIRLALNLAKDEDSVVIAGKGAEEVMLIGGERVDWNDKKVVQDILRSKIYVELSDHELVKANL